MTIQEDILAELTAEPIAKIIGELGQNDINILEAELTKNEWPKLRLEKIWSIKDVNMNF